jgi:hypothetical protein
MLQKRPLFLYIRILYWYHKHKSLVLHFSTAIANSLEVELISEGDIFLPINLALKADSVRTLIPDSS